MDFPVEIIDAVFKLRQKRYAGHKHCIVLSFPIIEIIKISNNHEVSTKLFYDYTTNTFEMQAPNRRFFSKISHYDYKRPERRWSRDKKYIFCLIKDLKFSGLWQYVSNKDFIIVNCLNTRADPKELLKNLDILIKE